jgi:hypothetical protein
MAKSDRTRIDYMPGQAAFDALRLALWSDYTVAADLQTEEDTISSRLN